MIDLGYLMRLGPTSAQCQAISFGWGVCPERGYQCRRGVVANSAYTYMCEEHLLMALVRKEKMEGE